LYYVFMTGRAASKRRWERRRRSIAQRPTSFDILRVHATRSRTYIGCFRGMHSS
jgi:hypothetical protein